MTELFKIFNDQFEKHFEKSTERDETRRDEDYDEVSSGLGGEGLCFHDGLNRSGRLGAESSTCWSWLLAGWRSGGLDGIELG